MVAHELNVVVHPDRIAVRAARPIIPPRRIQAVVLRGQRTPATEAMLTALREVADQRIPARPDVATGTVPPRSPGATR